MRILYKIISTALISYTLVFGLIGTVPKLDILNETIRNVYYHVPIWFTMLFLMAVSFYFAIRTLMNLSAENDRKSFDAASIGFFFSIPGIATGSLWAKYTWGTWWTFQDPKLNGVAISILLYLAYFFLRSSIEDEQKKARISAVYNIFAFIMMNVFIMILPRITDSLHPGNGGNPAFGKYDLDNNMRLVFYPAVVGWVMFGYWIFELKNRYSNLKYRISEN